MDIVFGMRTTEIAKVGRVVSVTENGIAVNIPTIAVFAVTVFAITVIHAITVGTGSPIGLNRLEIVGQSSLALLFGRSFLTPTRKAHAQEAQQ